MRGSIKLFEIFGISIEIHITFLLLPLLFGFLEGLKGVVLILGIFACVTFHELSHALQAKRFGVKVDRVVLLPIGGVAAMKSIPEKPSQEIKIAISGPLFNFILAAFLFYPMYYLLGEQIFFSPSLKTWGHTFAYLYWLNIILGVFNLLPAFPMDGGRILRAFLAQKMDFQKATKIAVNFGHIFSLLFVFLGIVSSNFWLIIIAIFVYMAASQEELQVDITETLKRFKVKDILPDQYITVSRDTSLSKVLEMIFHSHQEDFPVMEGANIVGFVTRTDIISAIHQYGLDKMAGDVMRKDFPSASPRDSLTRIHKLMEESSLRAIPIIESGHLVGIITMEDLSKVYSLMSAKGTR
ncbi:MAG: hypothetical protein AMJ78_01875 [Omnitrophica WOR_2 bacterium SM23_29]|nr:MAG: hypothetical protein AMJ78_01875 [Omnitrophica WOR_2 bacterium SM23_29]